MPFLSNRFLAMPSPAVPGKRALKTLAAQVFGCRFAYRRKYGFGFPPQWFGGISVEKEYTSWLNDRWVPRDSMQAWALNAVGLWAKNYLFGGWRQWAEKQKDRTSGRRISPARAAFGPVRSVSDDYGAPWRRTMTVDCSG